MPKYVDAIGSKSCHVDIRVKKPVLKKPNPERFWGFIGFTVGSLVKPC